MGKYDDAIGGGKLILDVEEVLNEESAKKVDDRIKKQKADLETPIEINIKSDKAENRLKELTKAAKQVKNDLQKAISSQKSFEEINKLVSKYELLKKQIKAVTPEINKNNTSLKESNQILKDTKKIVDQLTVSENKLNKTRKTKKTTPAVTVGVVDGVKEAENALDSVKDKVEDVKDAYKTLNDIVEETRRSIYGTDFDDIFSVKTAEGYAAALTKVRNKMAEIKDAARDAKKEYDAYADTIASYTGSHFGNKSTFQKAIKDAWNQGDQAMAAKLFDSYQKKFPDGKFKPEKQFGTEWSDNFSKNLEEANRNLSYYRTQLKNTAEAYGTYSAFLGLQNMEKQLTDGYNRMLEERAAAEKAAAEQAEMLANAQKRFVTNNVTTAQKNLNKAIDEYNAKVAESNRLLEEKRRIEDLDSYEDEPWFNDYESPAHKIMEISRQFAAAEDAANLFKITLKEAVRVYRELGGDMKLPFTDVGLLKEIDIPVNMNFKQAQVVTEVEKTADAYEKTADVVLRTQKEINEELQKEEQKLKDIEKQQDKNEAAREQFKKKQANYGKEVMGVEHAVYDTDLLKGAAKEIKEFNEMLETRNKFQEKYIKLCQIIEKYYVNDKPGKYSISNGVYKNLDAFFELNSDIRQLERYANEGQKTTNKEINALFKNVVGELKSDGSMVSNMIASGEVSEALIGQDLDREEIELNREMQRLYEERQAQLGRIADLRKEELDLIMKQGKEEVKATKEATEARLKLTLKKDGSGMYTAMDGKYEVGQDADGWKVWQRDNAGLWNLIGTYKSFEDVRNDATLLTREEIVLTDEVVKEVKLLHDAYESMDHMIKGRMPVVNKYLELLDRVKNGAMSAADAIGQLNDIVGVKNLPTEPVEKLTSSYEGLAEAVEKYVTSSKQLWEAYDKGKDFGTFADERNKAIEQIASFFPSDGSSGMSATILQSGMSMYLQDSLNSRRLAEQGAEETLKHIELQLEHVKEELAEIEAKKLRFADGTLLNDSQIAAVEKYCAVLKKSMGEAYDEAMALKGALDLVFDIKQGNIINLMDRFHAGNPASNAVLGLLTDMAVNNQKNRDAALRSINPDAYDKIIAEQKEAAEKAKAELKSQKSDFQKQWDEFVSAMLGGDAFENESNLVKGRILKTFSQYADTATEAIHALNKAWLSGELEGKSGKNKWVQAYIDHLNNKKEYYEELRNITAKDFDVDSLFGFGGTTTLDEDKAQSLRDEAAAWDELITKKKEYYGINIINERDVFVEQTKSLSDEFENSEEYVKKYLEVVKQVESGAINAAEGLKILTEFTKDLGVVQIQENNKAITSYEQLADAIKEYVDLAKQLKPTSIPEYDEIDTAFDRAGYVRDKDEAIAEIKAWYTNVQRIKSSAKQGLSVYKHMYSDGEERELSVNEDTLKNAELTLSGYIYKAVGEFGYTVADVMNDFSQKRVRAFVEKQINKLLEINEAYDANYFDATSFNEPIEEAMKKISSMITSAVTDAGNLTKVEDILDELRSRANQTNRHTLSRETNYIGQLIGVTTPDDELKINAKKIESYEELYEVITRYNELQRRAIIYGGENDPGLNEDEEKEYRGLIARIEKTSGKSTWDTFESLGSYAGPNGFINALATTLGIEIPKAIDDTIEAIKEENKLLEEQGNIVQQIVEQTEVQAAAEEKVAVAVKKTTDAKKTTKKSTKNNLGDTDDGEDILRIVPPNLDKSLERIRKSLGDSKKIFDLRNIFTEGDLQNQIDELVKKSEQVDFKFDSVSLSGEYAQIKLVNEALGLHVTELYQLKKATDDASEATLQFVETLNITVRNKEQEKYITKQAKEITDAEKWLLGATKRLESQKRSYRDSQKKIDGSTPLIDVDATTLEKDVDQTIDSLAAHIQNRINENMGKSISEGFKNQITQDLNALENEIKIQQLQQYTSTTMSASEAEAARQVIVDTIDSIAANAKKKNVFDQIRESYESLRLRLTDGSVEGYIGNNFVEAINEMRTLRSGTSKASSEEGHLQKILSLQEQLYNAKAKVAELDVKGKLDTYEGMKASRKAQELEEQYNASVKLLENETQRTRVSERQVQLEKELKQFKTEQINNQKNVPPIVGPDDPDDPNDPNKIREQYQSILNLVNKINTANERMVKFQQMDGGSGLLSKQVQGEINKKTEAVAKLQTVLSELKIGEVLGSERYTLPDDIKSIGTDYSQISAFINDAGVQASLTTAEIEKLVNALVKAGDIDLSMISEALNAGNIKERAKNTVYENKYFADKTKVSLDADGSTSLKIDDIQKLGVVGSSTKEKLEGLAQAIAKNSEGAVALTKDFSQGADGIARLDFSVFDKSLGSLRDFRIELGTTTGQIAVYDTTISKSLANIKAANNQLKSTGNLLGTLNASGIHTENDGGATPQVQKVLNLVEALQNALNTGADQNDITKLTKDLRIASTETDKFYKQMLQMESAIANNQAMGLGKINPNDNVYGQLVGKAQELASNYGNATLQLGKFDATTNTLNVSLTHANGTVEQFKVSMYGLGGECAAQQVGVTKLANSWDRFKASIGKAGKQLLTAFAGYNVFYKAIAEVRKGIGYVKEIDLALTELKKVTDETEESYAKFLDTAANKAGKIGSTISDFTEASANFARLGYTIEESANMAESAIIYKNVADGLDTVEEATDSIISTMKAFGIESNDTMGIIDRFNEVGNNFAITSAGIGEALQRSASALYAGGNTIDESIALVTAAM